MFWLFIAGFPESARWRVRACNWCNNRHEVAPNSLIAKRKLISYGAPICSKLLTDATSAEKGVINREFGPSAGICAGDNYVTMRVNPSREKFAFTANYRLEETYPIEDLAKRADHGPQLARLYFQPAHSSPSAGFCARTCANGRFRDSQQFLTTSSLQSRSVKTAKR